MATTTPNYGWDVPTSTDYVAQGAVAIETLGDDIDASLFSITGGKNVGLQHIATVTASSSSSVDITSCFTSSFDNYHIEANITNTSVSNTGIGFQMLVGSTPTGGTPWAFGSFFVSQSSGTGVLVASTGAATAWMVQAGLHSTGRVATASIDLKNPFTASRTSYNAQSFNTYGGGDTFSFAGGFTDSTSYNGIRFIPQSGGTMTGTFRLYGYRNS